MGKKFSIGVFLAAMVGLVVVGVWYLDSRENDVSFDKREYSDVCEMVEGAIFSSVEKKTVNRNPLEEDELENWRISFWDEGEFAWLSHSDAVPVGRYTCEDGVLKMGFSQTDGEALDTVPYNLENNTITWRGSEYGRIEEKE